MSIEANEVTATKVFEVTVKQERVVTVETTATVFAIDEIDAGIQGEEKHERAWLDVRNVWGVTDVGPELPDELPELTATIAAISKSDKARIVQALRTLAAQIETGELVWQSGGIHISGDARIGPLRVTSDLEFQGSQEISVGPTPTN